MSLEIYWKKAIEQTQLSIDDESLYPLKTDIITRDLYEKDDFIIRKLDTCLLYTSPSPRDRFLSRMPSSA